MTHHEILISGIGGQGVLFLTKLLYEAALHQGLPVFAYEIHGMSQRGGSVFSALKLGDSQSPQLFPGNVDTLICLESSELFAHIQYLKSDGAIILNDSSLTNDQSIWLDEQTYTTFKYNSDRDALSLGNPRISNLVLLGRYLDENSFIIKQDTILSILPSLVKPSLLQLNRRAFIGQ